GGRVLAHPRRPCYVTNTRTLKGFHIASTACCGTLSGFVLVRWRAVIGARHVRRGCASTRPPAGLYYRFAVKPAGSRQFNDGPCGAAGFADDGGGSSAGPCGSGAGVGPGCVLLGGSAGPSGTGVRRVGRIGGVVGPLPGGSASGGSFVVTSGSSFLPRAGLPAP